MNKILRLHTDSDGIVWCGQNGVRAVNSKLVPEEFVTHNSFRTAKLVRIMGVHDNAGLIVTAYNAQKKLNASRAPAKSALSIPNARLEVGSPLMCPVKALRKEIEELKAALARAKEEHQYDNLVHAEELRKALNK